MTVVIRIGHEYLMSFDPDAHAPGKRYPTGEAKVTSKLRRAMKFKNTADALTFYRTQSKVTPTRPDGKPNRPLTKFTIEIVSIDETG